MTYRPHIPVLPIPAPFSPATPPPPPPPPPPQSLSSSPTSTSTPPTTSPATLTTLPRSPTTPTTPITATPVTSPTAREGPERTETRTLLTFPTHALPSPRVVPQHVLRAFAVRYPSNNGGGGGGGAPPVQSQINRWLCCRCAGEGYWDPVGMVHCSGSGSGSARGIGTSPGMARSHGGGLGGGDADDGAEDYDACWRESCRHCKCVNCALYAGPLGRDPRAKLLIRTVGGLYASPRFVDPVYWECAGCGEWMRNRFDSRCVLGLTGCRNEGCVFTRWAGRTQLGLGAGEGGGGDSAPGAGLLMAASVVMNRYGQRLGTADQRVAVADGPWDWQRRALGDARCAIVSGLRAAMKRTGEEMQLNSDVDGSRIGRLWIDGEPVPHYPYRRPPPLDENDVRENNEYEGLYLAGMPGEPSGKGRDTERQTTASRGPRFCSAPTSPGVVRSVAANSSSAAFFPG
ncbi:uncharacterized protein B0H64DRAFT_365204 [Chaetomium fimeti]|uniref:Uncharacterized protein n=1 Tax=Chaetomium fimeti TaxID=1854472 RepID=A0AAE0HB67_9PEZI|nr:hypothetical protein B0H64DRAFT_365204 [Chaetomium fimeti]